MPSTELSQGRLKAAITNLTLLNDRFFKRCLKGQTGALGRMFSIILEEPVAIERAETEETLPNLLNRGVRLDAVGTDAAGHLYDLEMQTDVRGAEVDRALYNGAMLCGAKAPEGVEFPELPKVDVVFAVVADLSGMLGGDRPIYHLSLTVDETGHKVRTWLRIVYVNASPKWRDPSTPIGRLMCDLAQADPDRMYTKELADCVRLYKQDLVEGKDKEMSEFIRNEFRSELSDAKMEVQRIVATNMLACGDPVEKVARCAELPLDVVRGLIAQHAPKPAAR